MSTCPPSFRITGDDGTRQAIDNGTRNAQRSDRKVPRSSASPVARLRAICLPLPDTTEKVAWGEPTWRVNPRQFFRPPYVGPRGWVGVRIDRRPNWTVAAKLVEQAYRMVAMPKNRRV